MTIEDKLYHINIDPGSDFAGNMANIKAAFDSTWDGDFRIIDANSTKYIYIPQPVETSSVLLKTDNTHLYLQTGGIDLPHFFGRGINSGSTAWNANPNVLMSTSGMCLEFDMRYYSTKHFYTIGYSHYRENADAALYPQKLVCRAKNVITGEYHNCVIQFTHSSNVLFIAVAGQPSSNNYVELTAPYYRDNDVIRLRPITFGRFVVEGVYWTAAVENSTISSHLSVTKLYPGHNNFSDITINNKKYRGINSVHSDYNSIIFEV